MKTIEIFKTSSPPQGNHGVPALKTLTLHKQRRLECNRIRCSWQRKDEKEQVRKNENNASVLVAEEEQNDAYYSHSEEMDRAQRVGESTRTTRGRWATHAGRVAQNRGTRLEYCLFYTTIKIMI